MEIEKFERLSTFVQHNRHVYADAHVGARDESSLLNLQMSDVSISAK